MQETASAEQKTDHETPAPLGGEPHHALTPALIEALLDAIKAGDKSAILDLVEPLHAADMGDLLGLLRSKQRRKLLDLIGPQLDPEVLPELDEHLRDKVVAAMSSEALAAAVAALETDDSVYLLENLSETRKAEVLNLLPRMERSPVEKGLSYPEDTAGRLMRSELVAVPHYWTVGHTIDYMRSVDDLPDDFYEIFIVDPSFHIVGTVSLSRVARTRRHVAMGDIMEREQTLIPVTMDQEEVAYLFNQYGLISAAVVDEDERLVGVITVDDVVDVIGEEAEEDILRLGGVSETDPTDSVIVTTGRRFPWLLVNLLTAILASLVIAQFEAAIEKIVALAVLMPIVASMGGNAGTQTLTVAVRAIATREMNPTNAVQIVFREVFVAGFNGVLFSLIMGAIGGYWFHSTAIGLVLAAAMLINLLAAGIAGVLTPLALERLKIDPAMASGVMVTTVTDVVGFFSFLGLASILLL
ncbi:MAG: magnesium transporter [Alphaproteobacteria bacterium]|nr:magnesium transporter [Alphaproteobacteria bacterium]